MKWRDEVPLGDEDYAAIRAVVMREVRKSAVPRPGLLRLAFAAAALVATILFVRRDEHLAHAPNPVPHQALHVPAAARVVIVPPPAIRVVHHRRKRHRHKAEYQTVRMDIQTADPNIRIIWIANGRTQ